MTGRVYLIGAGPGDPELLTLKAARALGRAEVILVDELVNRGCLAHARSDAKVVEVGKRGGCKSTPQEFIEKLMVQTAKSGRVVARLKGGDPFVFGRGGEELQALLAQGLEVEVIPGITAGLALDFPVTHRGLTRGVTFVSGHAGDSDWSALARSGTTLVVYMGLRNFETIRQSLLAVMDAKTPACIVENGTLQTRRQRIATLATLSSQGFRGPALIVVGEVVRFARGARAEKKAA